MKLLFDQNISFRVLKLINEIFPDANHVKELNFENANDIEILHFAFKNNYQIVTFDSDFYELSNLNSNSPKIRWLRMGNTSTSRISEILLEKSEEIRDFILSNENYELKCLEISD